MLSLGSAQAFAGKFDAVGVMDETVQDGVGIGGIADDFVPTVDRELGCDHRGAAAIALFEDFQEIMAGGGASRRGCAWPNYASRPASRMSTIAVPAVSTAHCSRSWSRAPTPANFCRRRLD
jgi:hypothetical protein